MINPCKRHVQSCRICRAAAWLLVVRECCSRAVGACPRVTLAPAGTSPTPQHPGHTGGREPQLP